MPGQFSNPPEMSPGDKVYRYVWSGGDEQEPQRLTVVKVNPRTVVVHTDQGSQLRLRHEEILGRAEDWDD